MKKLLLLLLLVFVPTLDARQATPQSIVDELLAADRAFSVASSKSDVVNGLSAMFADEVVLLHAGGVASGKANAQRIGADIGGGSQAPGSPVT